MVTLKIHLPLNKLGFCLMCDSFFIELQNALFSFITSSQHQWLQNEFLSRITEHCRAATTIKETEQQQNSKSLNPRGAGLCSLDLSLPPEVAGVELHPYSPVPLQVKPVDGVSKAVELSLNLCKQIDFELFTHWSMCESPTHDPVRLNIGTNQQLPCEVSR